ncbi:MAG: YheU family protein [Pseudomonadota bacterium]
MRIPYDLLSTAALEGVIDDFVLREGTDYGIDPDADRVTLTAKREAVLAQLRRGDVVIVYDAELDSTTLYRAEDAPPA